MSSKRVWVLVLSVGLLAGGAWALPGGEGKEEREAIERAMERIKDLIHKAEQCEREGDIAAAAQHRDEAAALKKEISAFKERLAKQEAERREREGGKAKGDDAETREIMNGLEQGIHALKRAGWEEEAKRLLKIAQEIQRQRVTASEERERPKEGSAGKEKEGEELRRHFEILRLAMKGCIEANRPKEADRLEHAAHVLKLNAEGRRDAEAEEIRRKGPDREQTAELLAFAARCLREQGRADAAEMVEDLARKYGGKPVPLSRKGEKGHGEAREELLGRIERLEAMVRELEAALREVRRGEAD